MSVDITLPSMVLCDEHGVPIEGVTKSRSEVEAMEKASDLGDGVYILKRPDGTITVEDTVVAPPADPGAYQIISAEITLV